MKRLFALLLVCILCLSCTACKDSSTPAQVDNTQTEQSIRELIERNLDCYFLFYVAPLTHTTQQNSDGYYGTDASFFAQYSELKSFVTSTYTKETADALLCYPSKDTPLYKDVQGLIFVKPDVITTQQYNISWDEYTLNFDSISDKNCTFTLITTDFDGAEYSTTGSATNENGTWLLDDLIY